jgi:hypothetical protein
MVILETGTKQQFKRCVLDTVCTYVYRCGHVYVPSGVALDVLEYAYGTTTGLDNTDCDECRAAKSEVLYAILRNAQRESDQTRIEAERARALSAALVHCLPDEMACLRAASQYTCFGVDMPQLHQKWGVPRDSMV